MYFCDVKKGLSILLALLILLSSSGIVYSQHLCGGVPMHAKITLGEAMLSCGMMTATPSCDAVTIKKHSCCDNEYFKVTTDNHYSKAYFDIDFVSFEYVETAYFSQLVGTTPSKEALPTYLHYRPPPLEKDYQILLETFLI